MKLTAKPKIEGDLTSETEASTQGPSAPSTPVIGGSLASSSAALELGPQEYQRIPVGTSMPVGGVRRRRKGSSPSAVPREPLKEITEETDSEAEEQWEQVADFDKSARPDVEMSSESESDTLAYANQAEIDAAKYLTSLYNDLMLKNEITPEEAFRTLQDQMRNQAELHMFHKWDSMGRHA